MPKSLKTFFEEQNGNTDIKFPKPVAETFKTGSLHKFKSIEDANKYLSQNYGITADVETTAMGAAYLAGLAVGYWSSKEEVIKNWAIDKTFKPAISDENREERIRGWKKAVKYAYGWAKED